MASVLGFLWIFTTPLIFLAMYSFVFGVVFKPQWSILEQKKTNFVLFLFAGLIVFWIFAEVVNQSPGAIRSQASLVKKVRFPTHALPVVINIVAMVSWLANALLLLLAMVFYHHYPSWTILFAPLALVPMIFFTLGLSWFLAALGSYFRDVAQAAGIISLSGLFLSAVFFPIQAMPPKVMNVLVLNPVAVSVESFREVVLYRELPSPIFYATGLAVGLGFFIFGRYVFGRIRGGFTDVL